MPSSLFFTVIILVVIFMSNFLESFSSKTTAIFQKQFFKDSFWMLLSQVINAVLGIAYFIILARFLGAEYYGSFEGVKAIWAILFPFIGLGMGDILIQAASRDLTKFSRCWGDALLAFIFSVAVSLIVIFPLVTILLPGISPLFILLVFLADLVGLGLCKLAGNAFISAHQIKQASLIGIIYAVSKFIVVIFLPLFPMEHRFIAWGFLFCIGSIIPGLILLVVVNRTVGAPIFKPRSFDFSQVKQGFFFSISSSAHNINAQVDRSVLVALDTPTAAGVYSAGYRFIDIGFLPIMAILGASYARFFKHGEGGITGTLIFAKKLLPAACLYGLFSGIALIVFAPFVPKVLGEEYAQASAVLVWLAPMHLIGGIQFLAADILTGAGFQRSRSFVQVGAAVLNVSLNFFLIPIYSWKGAVGATLVSEVFKLVILWLIVFLHIKK
jgi:O-antigen/teichoic acid export membrane protein